MKINVGDPGKNHFRVSMVKSLVRVAAGICLTVAGLGIWAVSAGVLLIVAELLGVVEEMV